MKKIILTLLLSVILCSLYAQNKTGGNVNSKEPIAYADKEFLTGILDYDSLKNTPAPQNWPEPLNNTFKFTYVTGECRMIPSQFLFDAAKKLGVEKEYNSDQIDSEEYPEVTCKLTGILIQKTDDEYLVRAFYEADDIVPDTVSKLTNRPWYINNTPKKHFQAIYRLGKGIIKIIDDAYCTYYEFTGTNMQNKIFSNFDVTANNLFAHTEVEIDTNTSTFIKKIESSIFDNSKLKNAIHTYSCNSSDLYDDENNHRPMPLFTLRTSNALIENKIYDYTIDKLVDSNFATSYVENSENDEISFDIDFYEVSKNIKGLKIINGFAKNENLYKANNQVKTIVITGYGPNSRKPIIQQTWNLNQDMNFQYIELNVENCKRLHIQSTALYKGTKYNDTCIAELNILTDEGWIISK